MCVDAILDDSVVSTPSKFVIQIDLICSTVLPVSVLAR